MGVLPSAINKKVCLVFLIWDNVQINKSTSHDQSQNIYKRLILSLVPGQGVKGSLKHLEAKAGQDMPLNDMKRTHIFFKTFKGVMTNIHIEEYCKQTYMKTNTCRKTYIWNNIGKSLLCYPSTHLLILFLVAFMTLLKYI